MLEEREHRLVEVEDLKRQLNHLKREAENG